MSWFDQVTGSNEYERQSWRDSFNGGRAAGDLTGNINRRLDAERAAFGTTWGGSSTQPDALTLARSRAMVHTPSGGVRRGVGTGAGNNVVAPPVPAAGGGVGVPGVITIPWGPRRMIDGGEVKDMPLKRIGVGGPNEADGAISDVGWVRTVTGWTPVPSSDVKERIEDDAFQQAAWNIRNRVLPDLMVTPQPVPPFLDPRTIRYDFWSSEWREKTPADYVKERLPNPMPGFGIPLPWGR